MSKISNEVGRIDIFRAFAVAMKHVDCVIKRDVYPQKVHSCSKNICGLSFSWSKNIRGISLSCSKNIRGISTKTYHRCYCIGISLVER